MDPEEGGNAETPAVRLSDKSTPEKKKFTITAKILERSLQNFHCLLADRHMNL